VDLRGCIGPLYCTLFAMPLHARRRSASDREAVPAMALSIAQN